MDELNEESGRLFLALAARFRPAVAAVLGPKQVAWARRPFGTEEKQAAFGWLAVPSMALFLLSSLKREGKLLVGLKNLAALSWRMLWGRGRMSESEIGAARDGWVQEAAALFTRGWLDTLEAALPEDADPATVFPLLDRDLLPPLDGFDPTAIIAMLFDGQDVTAEDIRAVLRQVRAALPPGQSVPPETVRLLVLERRRFDQEHQRLLN